MSRIALEGFLRGHCSPADRVKPFLIRAQWAPSTDSVRFVQWIAIFYRRLSDQGRIAIRIPGPTVDQAAMGDTLNRHNVMASLRATATIAFCGTPVRPKMRR